MHWLLFLGALVAELWPPDETVSGYADRGATYVLVEMDGEAPPARATIRFPRRGRVEGKGPCNAYFARQGAPYPWIEIGAIGSTRMGCPDLDFEQVYFRALGSVGLAEVSGPVLILSAPGGPELVFQAEE